MAAGAQATGREAQKPITGTGEINLAAMSANVNQSGNPVRIRILRWSTDDERNQVLTALNSPAPAAAPADRGGAARGGRGGAGRGGRGGRRGGGEPGPPLTPIAALTVAIGRAPTVGFIWTNDVTGYAIKYAYHTSLPDGGERIIIAIDRRLGAYSTAWKPASTTATEYEFTLVELRLDAKGLGEGKTSLTTKVTLDDEAKTVALEDYAATPALLQNVKRS